MANRPEIGFGTLDQTQLDRMATIDEDRPFYMVNLMRFRDGAAYPDGRPTDLTGFEANTVYSDAFTRIAEDYGAETRFASVIDEQLLGDGEPWDLLGIAWYPSRAAFFAIVNDDRFADAEVHKEAGLDRSLVVVTERLSSVERQGIELPAGTDPSVALALPDPATVPYPPVGDDHPVVLVHFLAYRDQAAYEDGRETDLTGREALDLYTANTRDLAPTLGVRPLAWFDVEGELIGDGRDWDEIRLNWFPSRATFDALTADPAWAEGLPHRVAALEDTYAFITTPIVNRLPAEGTEPAR